MVVTKAAALLAIVVGVPLGCDGPPPPPPDPWVQVKPRVDRCAEQIVLEPGGTMADGEQVRAERLERVRASCGLPLFRRPGCDRAFRRLSVDGFFDPLADFVAACRAEYCPDLRLGRPDLCDGPFDVRRTGFEADLAPLIVGIATVDLELPRREDVWEDPGPLDEIAAAWSRRIITMASWANHAAPTDLPPRDGIKAKPLDLTLCMWSGPQGARCDLWAGKRSAVGADGESCRDMTLYDSAVRFKKLFPHERNVLVLVAPDVERRIVGEALSALRGPGCDGLTDEDETSCLFDQATVRVEACPEPERGTDISLGRTGLLGSGK